MMTELLLVVITENEDARSQHNRANIQKHQKLAERCFKESQKSLMKDLTQQTVKVICTIINQLTRNKTKII